MKAKNQVQFTNSLYEYASYANKFGGGVIPYHEESDILRLPADVQTQVHDILDQRLSIFRAVEIDKTVGPNLDTEKKLFREVLRSYSLQPVDGVEEYFQYGDIIEIYKRDMTQVYGNLQFMRFCSYDLFTLCTKPFYELYSRNTEINQQIQDCMQNCFSTGSSTQEFAVEPHFLREQHLNNKKVFKVHPKWISPLRGANGEIEACVLTNFCVEYKIGTVN